MEREDSDGFDELARRHSTMQMNEDVSKWYGWASPVGLGLFFCLVMIGLAALIMAVIVALRYAL